MRVEAPRFPSAGQALALVVAHFMVQLWIGAGLRSAPATLGLSRDAVDALTMFLSYGLVLGLAMRFADLPYGQLFHASKSSVAATVAVLTLPVLALVPAAVLGLSLFLELLQSAVPLSRWEESVFARFAAGSLPMVISICILAPFLEEMLFRGLILQGFLSRYARWEAIWLSSLLFGVAHLNIYQFFVGLILGLVLGWLYERSRSLIPCICLHGGYNSLIAAGYVAESDVVPAESWTHSWSNWAMAVLLALGGIAVLKLTLSGAKRPSPSVKDAETT